MGGQRWGKPQMGEGMAPWTALGAATVYAPYVFKSGYIQYYIRVQLKSKLFFFVKHKLTRPNPIKSVIDSKMFWF